MAWVWRFRLVGWYLRRSDAGGRIPGAEPAVWPDGPTAVLAGFRPFRRIGHPAVVTRHRHFYILYPAGG